MILVNDILFFRVSSPFWSCFPKLLHFLLASWLAAEACTACSSKTTPTLSPLQTNSAHVDAGISCGGTLRTGAGSIDFTFNEVTLPDPTIVNKTCLWLVLPDPLRTRFRLSVTRFDLSKERGDRLAMTTFLDYEEFIKAFFKVSETVKGLDLDGSILAVTLNSEHPMMGSGFRMTWDNTFFPSTASRPLLRRPSDDQNGVVSIHEVYNANAKTETSADTRSGLPGQGHGYVTFDLPSANALSTFSITNENQTGGSTLRVTHSQIHWCNGVNSRSCGPVPFRTNAGCPVPVIAEIQHDGVLWTELYWQWEKPQGWNVTSQFGFVFLFWSRDVENTTLTSCGGNSDRVAMTWDTLTASYPIREDFFNLGVPAENTIEYPSRYEKVRGPQYSVFGH